MPFFVFLFVLDVGTFEYLGFKISELSYSELFQYFIFFKIFFVIDIFRFNWNVHTLVHNRKYCTAFSFNWNNNKKAKCIVHADVGLIYPSKARLFSSCKSVTFFPCDCATILPFKFVSGRSRCANFPVCFRLHRFNFFNEVKYKWKWVTEHIITLYVEASHSFTVRVQTCPNVRWEHSRLVSISIYYATYRRSEIYHYSERLETSKTHFCICIYLSKTLTTADLEYIWLIQDLSMTFSGHR